MAQDAQLPTIWASRPSEHFSGASGHFCANSLTLQRLFGSDPVQLLNHSDVQEASFKRAVAAARIISSSSCSLGSEYVPYHDDSSPLLPKLHS